VLSGIPGSGAPTDAAARTAEAIRLVDHARRTGDVDLLNLVVTQFEQIYGATPQDDPDYEAAVINLAGALITQFEWTGKADALDHAIGLLQRLMVNIHVPVAGLAAVR
jgi:hypothetical protein